MTTDSGYANAFVSKGRETQIQHLEDCLTKVMAGRPQLAFVAGDAGVGKTTLLNAFCRRANNEHNDLIVAKGQCSDKTGNGDPYLPFKEILSLLTGDIDSRLLDQTKTIENTRRLRQIVSQTGEALVELGPDLVGTFVPGAGLVLRVGSFVAKKAGWLKFLEKIVEKSSVQSKLKPDQLYEQFVRVILRLAQAGPLILIVEDLHWADSGTLNLLFYVVRRIYEVANAHLLVIGSYRVAEIRAGRAASGHLLEEMLSDIQRYYGNVVIDLTPTIGGVSGRDFVNAVIDNEPNVIDQNFRDRVFQRTEGHPLFTVELLRLLQQQGVLSKNPHGQWCLVGEVDLDTLPNKVEAVIGERLDQLGQSSMDVLTCASVEGEQFTAEVVVRVRHRRRLDLASQLDELETKHRVVMALNEESVNRLRVHRYSFQHSLFQEYLYKQIGAMQREELHMAVGKALEVIYGGQAEGISSQLARHFDIGGDTKKAIKYYRQAADQAAGVYANDVALKLYNRALELTQARDDPTTKFELLNGQRAIFRLRRDSAKEEDILSQLASIANELADESKLARIHIWYSTYYRQLSDYDKARNEAVTAVATSRKSGDLVVIGEALAVLAAVANYQNDFDSAYQALSEALKISQQRKDRHAEADTHAYLGMLLFRRGELSKAQVSYEQALSIQQQIGDRGGEANSRHVLAYILIWLGDYDAALHHAEQSLRVSGQIGDRDGEAESLLCLGSLYCELGDFDTAITYHKQASTIHQELGDQRGYALALLNLGLSLHFIDQFQPALEYLKQALQIGKTIHGLQTQAIAYTYIGYVYERMKRWQNAQSSYNEAVHLWRQITNPRIIESIAGEARCAMEQGEIDTARKHVDDVLGRISAIGSECEGVEYPLWVYLSCVNVLRACKEETQASYLLETAHQILMRRLDTISRPTLRNAYLNQVPCNHSICDLWNMVHNSSFR